MECKYCLKIINTKSNLASHVKFNHPEKYKSFDNLKIKFKIKYDDIKSIASNFSETFNRC